MGIPEKPSKCSSGSSTLETESSVHSDTSWISPRLSGSVCRHRQLFLDLHAREERNFALQGPCDEARFFRFLKQADGSVMILFFPKGDGRPQANLRKAPTAVVQLGEHTLRG